MGKGEASDEESGTEEKNKENEKGSKKETEGTSLQQWADFGDPDDSAYDNDEQSLYGKMEAMIAKAGQCHASSAKKNDAEWEILYDTGSTHNVLINDKLFTGPTKKAPRPLIMSTNGGEFECTDKGTFPGIGPAWFNPNGIINVLSASKIRKSGKFITTYHEDERGSFYLIKNKKNGRSLKLEENSEGIYVHTVEAESRKSSVNNKTTVNQYSLVSLNTVESNKQLFSSRERKNAERAGHLMKSMGFPSRADMTAMLSTGVIRNCPISGDDVRNYFKIYGGLEGAIKGKTVRRRPSPVREDLSEVPIPRNILGPRNNITLCIDTFFVNKAPFLQASRGKSCSPRQRLSRTENLQQL